MKKLIIFGILILFISSCQDSLVEPDPQFVQIYFKYGFRNELNTFTNTYQKDLVMDGTIKVKFWLTEIEQNRILEKANAVNYFAMRDTFKYVSPDSINVYISPDPGVQLLRIKYQSEDKTTVWRYPTPENDEEFNDLLELQHYIVTMIESKREFKVLPQARGGYD